MFIIYNYNIIYIYNYTLYYNIGVHQLCGERLRPLPDRRVVRAQREMHSQGHFRAVKNENRTRKFGGKSKNCFYKPNRRQMLVLI